MLMTIWRRAGLALLSAGADGLVINGAFSSFFPMEAKFEIWLIADG